MKPDKNYQLNERPYVVYKITNQTNGKVYIGITCQKLSKRWHRHTYDALNRPKLKYKFGHAIKKYGTECWDKEILLHISGLECANIMEIRLIEYYDSFKTGYNSTLGGDGTTGVQCSVETRKKRRLNRLGKKWSEETYKRFTLAKTGYKLSDKVKQKMAKRSSKSWIIILPNGTTKTIKGLKTFCKKNKLSYGCMQKIAYEKRLTNHKGFSCRKMEII